MSTPADLAQLRERVPYAAFLDVQVTIEDGQPRFRLPYREALVGNVLLPALHGGVVAGFMENAALLHLLVSPREVRIPRSIDFSIDYLRPANPVDCHARCEVTRQGRRVAQVQVRCWQDERGHPGKTRDIALARAHFLLGEQEPVTA